MSQIPISTEQLEVIVEVAARNLLEKWAIDDRFTIDEIALATKNAVDDTAFVINEFMSLFNETMFNQSKSI
jgi:hypothetical protein